jgi:hypothetical protein
MACRAFSMDVSLMSVANTCIGGFPACDSRNSVRAMAMLYGSSPVEQPGTQIRMGSAGPRPFRS